MTTCIVAPLFAILAASPSLQGQHSPPALDLPGLLRRAAPSVVTIVTYDSFGEEIGTGTGFLIDKGVVTNWHVVDNQFC